MAFRPYGYHYWYHPNGTLDEDADLEKEDDESSKYAWWLIGGIVVLAVAGVIMLTVTSKP